MSSCFHPVQSQFCLYLFGSGIKNSGPEKSTMISKLTPVLSQWQAKHHPVFHQPQNGSQHNVGKGKNPNNYTPVEESAEKKVIPNALGPWTVKSLFSKLGDEQGLHLFPALVPPVPANLMWDGDPASNSKFNTDQKMTHQHILESFKSIGWQCGHWRHLWEEKIGNLWRENRSFLQVREKRNTAGEKKAACKEEWLMWQFRVGT